jgi:hypothetical protein
MCVTRKQGTELLLEQQVLQVLAKLLVVASGLLHLRSVQAL